MLADRFEITGGSDLPRQSMARAGPPPILVDAAIADHFKVLQVVMAWRAGIVEGIDKTLAFQGDLLYIVDHVGKLDAGGFIDGRRNIGHMSELRTQSACILDVRRPGDNERIARTAQV